MAKKKENIKLADFPEEVDEANGVTIYGDFFINSHLSH